MICKCCGKEAKWCGDEPDACETGHNCDRIVCRHCGMQYELSTEAIRAAETAEEARILMLVAYNGMGEVMKEVMADYGLKGKKCQEGQ